MAQANYTPIQLYRSTTASAVPTSGNLAAGELAINTADGKLFYKNSGGAVRLLSIGYGSSTVTPTNGGVQYGTGSALALTAAGSSGQILRSNGAAAPTWENLSALGVSTISFGTTGLTPNSATSGAVTVAGTLATTNGGTGLTSFTANGVIYASSTSALASGSALTFDGTTLGVGTNSPLANTYLDVVSSGATYPRVRSTTATAAAFYFQNSASGTSNTDGFFVGVDGSLNGYVYNYENAPVIFGVNNSEAMRLTSTSLYTASGINVGIGTSSPAYKLDVSTASASNFIRTGVTGSNSGAGVIFQGAISGQKNWVIANQYNVNGGLEFTQTTANGGSTIGATPSMVLDSSGNLGLGVTPSAWTTTFDLKAMQVYGSALASNGTSGYLTNNAYYATASYTPTYIAASSTPAQAITFNRTGANDIQFLVAPSGTAGNAITFTQAMTLDASGRLGVGTTSPSNIGVTAESTGSNSVYFTANNTTGYNFIAGVATAAGYGLLGMTTNHALAFLTNNTERARITSGGDVGIGTSSPATKLEAVGVIRASSGTGQLNIGITGGIPYIQGYDSATAGNRQLAFYTGTEVMRLDSSGNLGLGVTPSAWLSSYRAIDIQNYGAIASRSATNSLEILTNAYRNSATNYIYKNNGTAQYIEAANGAYAFYTAASGTAGNAISFTQAMTLNADGKLSIGTTSAPSGSGVRAVISNANGGGLQFDQSGSGGAVLPNGGSAGLQFFTYTGGVGSESYTERARITSGGDLLVGTTSNSNTSRCFIENAGSNVLTVSNSVAGGYNLITRAQSNGGTYYHASFEESTTQRGSITSNGSATAYNTSSDYRLKNIDGPLTGSGEFIDALKPKVGTWKTNGSKFVGFLAHEVQEVSPGSVVGTKDAVDADGNPIMQAMEYGSAEFIANIIAELQSLRQRVALLEGN